MPPRVLGREKLLGSIWPAWLTLSMLSMLSNIVCTARPTLLPLASPRPRGFPRSDPRLEPLPAPLGVDGRARGEPGADGVGLRRGERGSLFTASGLARAALRPNAFGSMTGDVSACTIAEGGLGDEITRGTVSALFSSC
jgi:hypothetical protein